MRRVILDCLDEVCPTPLKKTRKQLERLREGDVLIVLVNYTCALKDVPEWARKAGHYVEVEEGDEDEWEILIEKTH